MAREPIDRISVYDSKRRRASGAGTVSVAPPVTATSLNALRPAPPGFEELGFCAVREVTVDGRKLLVVDAKELHGFLRNRTKFRTWITRQVERCRLRVGFHVFVDDRRFRPNLGETSPQPASGRPEGGRPEKVYVLTLDGAKHVAMADKGPVGHLVRDYFIQLEAAYLAELEAAARRKQPAPPVQPVRPVAPARSGAVEMTLSIREYLIGKGVPDVKLADARIFAVEAIFEEMPGPLRFSPGRNPATEERVFAVGYLDDWWGRVGRLRLAG